MRLSNRIQNNQYLIRLDDACPTLDREKWLRMEKLLGQFDIKPMVGVIPDNRDEKQLLDTPDPEFWHKVKSWQDKGWEIALHGYDHCYVSDKGQCGLNPIWKRSEFSGLPLVEQKEKIRKGVTIMREHGFNPKYFFAPSHTFDENTLTALREESDIRIISDTVGRYPYKKDDFWFVPQITGHCVKMPFDGIYTFCFHPNTMNDAAFLRLEAFLKQYCQHFIAFKDIKLDEYGEKKLADRILSWAFFSYRKIKGLK